MKINTKSMLYGAMILSTTNLIIRLLGFVYRVIISRMTGPQGMGLIQLVMPVFHIAVTLTSAGIPVAVSRLISEKNAKKDISGMSSIMKAAFTIVLFVSAATALLALFNLDFIAGRIIKDMRTKGALFILFPCIVFIGTGTVLKGFFYGIKDIHPPALSGILEQLVRMAAVLGLLFWFMPKNNPAFAAMLVMLGTVLGEIVSLLILHSSYYRCKTDLQKQYRQINIPAKGKSAWYDRIKRLLVREVSENLKKTAGSIIAIALPITATRLIHSFMSAANSILIPQRLTAGGMPQEEAIGLFGIMSGMVMPLLFLPFSITNALTVVIIPNLSESLAMKKWEDIRNKINKSIKMTSIIGFPSTALLASLGRPVGDLLYQQPLVGTFLIPLSLTLVFHAQQHTLSGILQGLGRQNRAAVHYIIGSIIQLMCSWFLLADPRIGIWGMVIGFSLSTIAVSSINMITVLKTVNMNFYLFDWVLKPAFAALLLYLTTNAVYGILDSFQTPAVINLVLSASLGLTLFAFSLWAVSGIPSPGRLIKKIY